MYLKALKTLFDSRGVLFLTLNCPQVRNAFDLDLIHELEAIFTDEGLKQEIKAIVIRGEGSAFCAGGDLEWMKKAIHLGEEENFKETFQLAQLFEKMNTYPKPLLAAVHGAVVGGGIGLVSVCDIVIAAPKTRFSFGETKLGIVPACIGPFVIAKIGASYARRFFLTGEAFSAEDAEKMGLVHEVVHEALELDMKVEYFLAHLLQSSSNVLSIAKKLILDLSWPEKRESLKNPLEYVAQVLAKLRISKEAQEGIGAFFEKRKPFWSQKR